MVGAILVLLLMPLLHISKIRSAPFRPLYRKIFWLFVANFFLLMWLGQMPAEEPFVIIAQASTLLYFGFFLVLTPFVG
jgi:ubiquinol-cytochrome c reductase cytochrome b subunit